jgi:hypothetical protein
MKIHYLYQNWTLISGIQLTCTKPEWVWTVIWKPHVMPAAKVTLMPDTATFFFSKSQTLKVIQCEPHYKQWMVCLVPWDGSEHSWNDREREGKIDLTIKQYMYRNIITYHANNHPEKHTECHGGNSWETPMLQKLTMTAKTSIKTKKLSTKF